MMLDSGDVRYIAEQLIPDVLEKLGLNKSERIQVDIMADVSVNIEIVVSQPSSPLTVDISGVPATAVVGEPYSGTIVASGGTSPYTFTLTEGSFPDGIALNTDGTITGTSTDVGDFNATVNVADSAGNVVTAKVGKKK
jgi:hypothetical protein